MLNHNIYSQIDIVFLSFSSSLDAFDVSNQLVKAPLPPFSAMVTQHLTGANARPERVWSLMINEAAMYYLGKWPSIGDQAHYKIIGTKMHRQYPEIALDGTKPWVSFAAR